MSSPEPGEKPVDYASYIEKHQGEIGIVLIDGLLAHSISATDADLALPNFDDPNIDKDQAIAGVIGIGFLLIRLQFSLTLF